MGKAGAIALKTVVVLLMVVMLTACARVDDFMSAKYNIQIGNYRQNEYYEPSEQAQVTIEPMFEPEPVVTSEPTATPRPTPEPKQPSTMTLGRSCSTVRITRPPCRI